jgi:signal transduction histidine kinase/ligand-binding sensor domain-containing protein
MGKYFAIFIFCFVSSLVQAQDLRITSYQVEQGLPNPLTKASCQDDLGFMWIASDLGLVSFDGKSFILYKDALPSIYIKAFFKRKNGDFLVIHDMGVSQIVHTLDTLYFNHVFGGSRVYSDTTLFYPKGAYEDSKERLWISEYKSVSLLVNGKLKRYVFDDKARSISFNRSFRFAEDRYGTFWVFSQQGFIFYYDEPSDTFIEVENVSFDLSSVNDVLVTPNKDIWLATTFGVQQFEVNKHKHVLGITEITDLQNVSCLAKDELGNFFLGTWYKGLYRGSLKDGKLDTNPIPEVNQKVINDIFVNHENETWSSSDEGLVLLQPSFFNKLSIESDRAFILSLTYADNGKVYATNGGLVIEIDNKGDGFQARTLYDLEDSETIQSVIGKDGAVYFSTNKENVFWLKDGKINKVSTPVKGGLFYMMPDRKGNIWICQYEKAAVIKLTPEKEMVYYGPEKGIEAPVMVIKESQDGEMYVGGRGEAHYLYRYDEGTDSFKNISPALHLKTNDFTLDDIALGKNGVIWMATNNGLFRYQDNQLQKIEAGLLKECKIVKALAINKAGNLWIGTDIGLFKYDGSKVFLFEDFNGLPAKPIGYRCLQIDREERVWAGTASGVGYANDALKPLKKTAKPIFLALKVGGEKVKSDDKVFVNKTYLEAKFVSTTYPSNKLIYQYRLKGLNDEWIDLGDKQDVLVPQIPYGNFTFEVRALQQGEFGWSESLTFDFLVEPAWYLTEWAWGVYFMLLIGFVILVVKLNTARLVIEKKRLEMVVAERTAQIVQQKEEIETQRDNLIFLNEEILNQKEEIESQRDKLVLLNEDLSEKKNKLEEKSLQLEKKSHELEIAFDEINQQKQELEKLNATKNKFFSIVAHDLKGPINSFSSFADLLANHTDSMTMEEIKRVAIELGKAVKNTSNLTENLLTWARAQMEKLSHKPENLLISQIIEENEVLLKSSAQNKNIRLITDSESDTRVFADKDQLTFVIRNLISNAIKFTKPGGEVRVTIKVTGVQAEVSVIDTGVGMEEGVAQKIFDIGTKHSTLGTSGEKGTGLGLLLCKEFVERNGGGIWVESKVGQGTKFSFSLGLALKEEVKV